MLARERWGGRQMNLMPGRIGIRSETAFAPSSLLTALAAAAFIGNSLATQIQAAEISATDQPAKSADQPVATCPEEATANWAQECIARLDPPVAAVMESAQRMVACGNTRANEARTFPNADTRVVMTANGESVAGFFGNTVRFGCVVYRTGNGAAEYTGEWWGTAPHGFGVFKLDDGTYLAGRWFNGKLDGYGARFDREGHVVEQGAYLAGVPVVSAGPSTAPDAPKPITAHIITADDYPPVSIRLSEQGRVSFSYNVTEQGTTADCRVTNSSGKARLDDAACKVVQHWRFQPARSGGIPVVIRMTGDIIFQLTPASKSRR